MKFVSDIELSDFFSKSPLYSKVKFLEIGNDNQQVNVFDFLHSKGYRDFCQNCKDFQTFRFKKIYGSQLLLSGDLSQFNLPDNEIFDFSFDVYSTCQFCSSNKDFFLKIYTLENATAKNELVTFYLKKIGQFPPIERRPESEVYNYLIREDRELYSKALANLSIGYGIGAYAYFRRIAENEIKRVIEDISKLEYEHSAKVRQAWDTFNNGSYQMAGLIEAITVFLPVSLKEIGGNPLKLLYQQTSEGIHSFSEEECLEKSIHIDKLLQFVIKRTNSLKSEIQDIQKAINFLSK